MDPVPASSLAPDEFPHLVVTGIGPSIDEGRYAVKRLLGDVLRVGADIFKDGNDLLAGRVLFCGPGERRWQSVPLTYSFEDDRWYGDVPLARVGEWRFTVEAWVDLFGTWRSALQKKAEARQDVGSELIEGAEILREAERHARGEDHGRLAHFAELFAGAGVERKVQVKAALSPELEKLMSAHEVKVGATRAPQEYRVRVDPRGAGFAAWYEMFPRSATSDPARPGTFRDAEGQLPRIAALGFDVVYLPPIHPIGRTHRKGPNNSLVAKPSDPGSPWAIGNEQGGHTAVAPELGALADFRRFVAAADRLGLEVALDYALQCSPDHPWVREHPEWFFIRPDGTIKYAENPPKKYEDIYPINFWSEEREALWDACRDILLFWIEQGVRTFRVDNPHTKPFAFWEWVISEVHRLHPEVVFLSEAFTRPKRMQALAKLGFTQSYTYFTWRNTAEELQEYLTELTTTEMAEYFRANFFVNTPDILHEYLQEGGRPAFRIRLFLAATLSPVYGIYSGFELYENVPIRKGSEEYLDSEKYQVRVRSWSSGQSLDPEITLLNRLRRQHGALQRFANISFHEAGNPEVLFYVKAAWQNDLLCAVTVDPAQPQEAELVVPLEQLGLSGDVPFEVENLLTGERQRWCGSRQTVAFDPAGRIGYIWRVVRPEGGDGA
ncbi:MAG TPA: alpha-1,4-glucan--maltose-1-phosphate maltosyltransferase [Gemmatimonadales bacterium]|nr:alpha-1,4-glucan--maltose-1-phosphate maltosyltransferase [Gemmatimonadales bacterium]